MKKKYLILLSLILLLTACEPFDTIKEKLFQKNEQETNVDASAKLEEKIKYNLKTIGPSNIDNTVIYAPKDKKDDEIFVINGNGNVQFGNQKSYQALIINGNLSDGKIIKEGNISYIPLKELSNYLKLEIKWDEVNRKSVIYYGENILEIFFDPSNYKNLEGEVKLNAKNVNLNGKVQIIDDAIYVPDDFPIKALQVDVSYVADQKTKGMIEGINQIRIEKYDKDAVPLSEEEAVEHLRNILIDAYEKLYGKYLPFEENKKLKDEEINSAKYRKRITDLKKPEKLDRFYVFELKNPVWVDKFTADVYVFTSGETISIRRFNPYSSDALTILEDNK